MKNGSVFPHSSLFVFIFKKIEQIAVVQPLPIYDSLKKKSIVLVGDIIGVCVVGSCASVWLDIYVIGVSVMTVDVSMLHSVSLEFVGTSVDRTAIIVGGLVLRMVVVVALRRLVAVMVVGDCMGGLEEGV